MKEKLRKAFLIETIINFCTSGVLNALCAWLINKQMSFVDVNIWSSMVDLYITAHCTSLLTVFFSHSSAKRYCRLGAYTEGSFFAGFAKNPLLLGLLVGDISFIIGAVLVNVLFALLHVSVLPLYGFVVYKGFFGALTGAATANIALQRFMLKDK